MPLKPLRLIAVLLLTAVANAFAGAGQDDEQDRLYIECMARRLVGPQHRMTKEDLFVCLAEAGIEDPGEAARDTATNAWRDCIVQKAVDLDDAISPATDVARVVVRQCKGEWRAYAASLALPPRTKRKMADGLEQYAVDDAVEAVLLTRRRAKEIKNTPAAKRH